MNNDMNKEKFIAQVLRDYDNNVPWKKITEEYRLHRSTVEGWIKKAKRAGWVTKRSLGKQNRIDFEAVLKDLNK